MEYLSLQAGRFWWWILQGGNSNVVLIAVTIYYAYVTHKMMSATARQAKAMMMPQLWIFTLRKNRELDEKVIGIRNVGTQSVIVRDVVVRCYPMGRKPIVRECKMFNDQLWSVDGSGGINAELGFDFSSELAAIGESNLSCAFVASILVSDIGRHVSALYEYAPVSGITSCQLELPLQLRWRLAIRPLTWRYYSFRNWLRTLE